MVGKRFQIGNVFCNRRDGLFLSVYVDDIKNWLGRNKNIERHCELANKTNQQLDKVATPCFDDHQFKEEELGSVGELSKVCSNIVLKCLHLARIG